MHFISAKLINKTLISGTLEVETDNQEVAHEGIFIHINGIIAILRSKMRFVMCLPQFYGLNTLFFFFRQLIFNWLTIKSGILALYSFFRKIRVQQNPVIMNSYCRGFRKYHDKNWTIVIKNLYCITKLLKSNLKLFLSFTLMFLYFQHFRKDELNSIIKFKPLDCETWKAACLP